VQAKLIAQNWYVHKKSWDHCPKTNLFRCSLQKDLLAKLESFVIHQHQHWSVSQLRPRHVWLEKELLLGTAFTGDAYDALGLAAESVDFTLEFRAQMSVLLNPEKSYA
jgi:hypothetical protein